ncbi:pyrroloquinoline quinone biosynthesis protein PqqE [Orrella daihaiensis]|uniref:PqqA peptide cyclase n=1 Tax=Orrella daihaiensis TaxID=2782176 RepID=A0ABY4AKU4_9BURK|nr:pyrroloquinoline quinone biosynthesis protein PqqE [Orrella daihaiensis]UOD50909.1 pyrroloquinoline quinone biosynthesis protein PqqE [Orrella daihaiensis]
MAGSFETTSNATAIKPPFWVLAELTYRCPLHCVFCSNPVNLDTITTELDTQTWKDMLAQARELGAVQLGFSGGEPLQRDDLEELVAYAHELGFYTNLITSGVGLIESRAKALKTAGLDHVQLSFQDSTAELNDFLSHTRTFELKQRVAKLIKSQGWPMVMNVVLHRHNLAHVGKIIEMALDLDAQYLELANTQYYGWAWKNRLALMPSKDQLLHAETVVNDYRKRIGDRCQIIFVVPDYFEDRPKACMNGWGNVFLAIAPDGLAMPCHAARELPGLNLPNVQTSSVHEIWYESQAFNAYRGEAWMAEPCRSCDERHKDFGGCRCQAWLLTGQANQADPVCSKSPYHERVVHLINRPCPSSNEQPLVFRQNTGLSDRE